MSGKQIKNSPYYILLWFPFISTPLYSYRGFIVHKFSFTCMHAELANCSAWAQQATVCSAAFGWPRESKKFLLENIFHAANSLILYKCITSKCWHCTSKSSAPFRNFNNKNCKIVRIVKIHSKYFELAGCFWEFYEQWAYWLTADIDWSNSNILFTDLRHLMFIQTV